MFEALSYVKPGWWLLLARSDEKFGLADYDLLEEEDRELVGTLDESYESRAVAKWDWAYCGFYRGVMADPSKNLARTGERVSADSEYRFLRRYFSCLWSYYFLFIRCLQLHNPVTEVRAFLRNRKVKRVDLFEKTKTYDLSKSPIDSFDSRVTVVIPTLNRYEYLKDCLHDLEIQTHKAEEILVIDQSEPYRPDFYDQFDLPISVIRQQSPGLWKARNRAIERATTDHILLYDDDSRVDRDWIAAHLNCIDELGADVSSGVSLSKIGAEIPQSYWNFRQAEQLDTGNVMLKRKVFENVGLFDEQFEGQRMGDAEFGLRAFLSGSKMISNPDAKRIHLKVEAGGLREMGSWDAFRPKSITAPRPVPSVLYLYRKYFGDRAAFRSMIASIPPSVIPYRFKWHKGLMFLSYLTVFFLFPLYLYQGGRSWLLSSKKLREGALIPELRGERES